jgi:uncharacterized metal-binding protein
MIEKNNIEALKATVLYPSLALSISISVILESFILCEISSANLFAFYKVFIRVSSFNKSSIPLEELKEFKILSSISTKSFLS